MTSAEDPNQNLVYVAVPMELVDESAQSPPAIFVPSSSREQNVPSPRNKSLILAAASLFVGFAVVTILFDTLMPIPWRSIPWKPILLGPWMDDTATHSGEQKMDGGMWYFDNLRGCTYGIGYPDLTAASLSHTDLFVSKENCCLVYECQATHTPTMVPTLSPTQTPRWWYFDDQQNDCTRGRITTSLGHNDFFVSRKNCCLVYKCQEKWWPDHIGCVFSNDYPESFHYMNTMLFAAQEECCANFYCGDTPGSTSAPTLSPTQTPRWWYFDDRKNDCTRGTGYSDWMAAGLGHTDLFVSRTTCCLVNECQEKWWPDFFGSDRTGCVFSNDYPESFGYNVLFATQEECCAVFCTPTISPSDAAVTSAPTFSPTPEKSAIPTYYPTMATDTTDLSAVELTFFCGADWADAEYSCKKRCPTGDGCPDGESCYMGTSCTEEMGYPESDDEIDGKNPVDQVHPLPEVQPDLWDLDDVVEVSRRHKKPHRVIGNDKDDSGL